MERVHFKTNVYKTLDEILEKKQSVCQDFAHLFCALARQNNIPIRYVSVYLYQCNGYFGDARMNAWVEVYVPKIDWVGFESTNSLMATNDHIKVAYGKNYNDCSPLRGVVQTSGKNKA